MNEFLGYLKNEGDSGAFFAFKMFIALLLVGISFRYEISKRNKLAGDTPNYFSNRFMFLDNIWRLLWAIGLVYVFVRFAVRPLLGLFNLKENTNANFIASGVLGLLSDQFALYLKKIKFLANKKIRQKFEQAGMTGEEQKKMEDE